jgi:tripartite-type tricarboxylate transporter receptor subunit TctC
VLRRSSKGLIFGDFKRGDKMSNRILTLPIALALVFLSLCISSALSIAQSYPTKPIRIVVPFPPGGSNDTVARVVAAKLSEKLGQTVITDNRPGSGGNVGLELVEKSAPDGYSLLVHSLEFESRNLIRVTVIGKTAYLLVVHPSVPVKTAKEMVALARAKPSSLTYASSGVGSVAHIAMEQFAFAAGLELVHVPYKGMAPAMVDLLGGQIQTAFFHPSQAGASVDSGRVRAIGISALVRDPRVPDLRCTRLRQPRCRSSRA